MSLKSLEVHYDATHDLAETLRLGRLGEDADREDSEGSDLEPHDFPIDGASGEIIESIEVAILRDDGPCAYSALELGVLESMKVSYLSHFKD